MLVFINIKSVKDVERVQQYAEKQGWEVPPLYGGIQAYLNKKETIYIGFDSRSFYSYSPMSFFNECNYGEHFDKIVDITRRKSKRKSFKQWCNTNDLKAILLLSIVSAINTLNII